MLRIIQITVVRYAVYHIYITGVIFAHPSEQVVDI